MASYAAYKDTKKGAALLVGIAVIGVLYLLLGPMPGTTEQGPKSVPAPTAPSGVSPSSESLARSDGAPSGVLTRL
ncbi:hypothetical protein ACLQ18_41485 [Streptomyces sp. DT193]|uniref:hypothetical protein n=1 Tax=Streptomyces sp. DT193 TaxID=3393418 RepID=UPI003CF2CA5D